MRLARRPAGAKKAEGHRRKKSIASPRHTRASAVQMQGPNINMQGLLNSRTAKLEKRIRGVEAALEAFKALMPKIPARE